VLRSASTSDCSRLVPISLSLQPAAIPFGTLSLDLTGATTNYLVWTNAAKCGASFNTSTNWPATNFPATLYIEGVTTSSVVRDLAWTLSYWTNTAVGTPVVTDLLYTTVMDLTLDAYQPDKTTAITNEARHALGMVLSPNTVDADTNGVRDEADAVFNGAADTNAMGVVIFRQMVGITNFIGLSNVYVQVAGPIRLFRPGATNREPCLVSGGASLDIASQISTGDVRMLVEAAAGGSATITLSLANVISDYVNVTVLPVPTDSDVDGICEQGGGSLNIPEVTSVEPVSLLPWSSVQLGRGSLPCGLTVAAYLTCWYVPTNDATFLRQNMYNLDTQVLPDSGDGCTRVVRPNGRVVSFNANGLPQMPDLGRTYRLVGSRAAGYTLVFASGYKHLFDAAGDLSKIEDPNGTTFGTSDNNWPTVSSRTNADLVAAIDSPNYGTNGTLTCKLSYDTTNHLIGVSSDYTTLTRSQTNGTWYLHTVAGTAARDTSLNINDLTIRRTDDVPEIWKRKNSGTRIHDSICDRSGALTHYAIACEDAGDRICQIARLGAYSGGIAEITTTFGIQTNVTVAGFGQVQWIVSPNGGFTYQTYDSLNRVTNILASLGPARQDRDRLATATPPAMANCRATTFDYTGVGNDGNRDEDFNRPRTITDYYQGTAVSRAYYVYASSSRETKATVNPADEYSDTSNLTTSVTFGSGTFAGFPSSLVDPCENTTTFDNMQHDNGVKVTASVDDDPADEGTITYYDEHGWVTRIDRAHSGNSVVTLSSNVFDSLGHLLFTFYPDGRADAYQYNDWGACTQSSNRESVVTTYAYDALLRLTNTVCNGVTNRYTDFDSFGNARTITTMGGNETRTVTRTYDKAGRLLSERAPFVGTTCYDVQLDLTNGVAGSFGGQLQSITRGNHTVTNEYYRDGTLAGTYGNSAHPVSYEYGLTNSRPFSRAYYFPSLVTSNRLVPITTPTTATITRLSLDAAGLQQQIVFGDGHAILTTCDNNGRVTCRQDENKHRVFTSYDPAGRVQRTTLDLNNDGVAGSSDPYEEQTYAFATHHGASVFKTTTERLDTPSSTICVGHTYARTDGQGVWSVDADNKETYTKTTYSGTTRTRKIDLPNGQNATVKFDQGLLTSYKPAASAATTTIAQRDGLLRPIKVVDTKGSTTVEYAPSTGATNYTKVTKPTGGYTKCSVDAYGQATTRETRQGTNTLTTTCDWNMTGEPTKLSGGNSQPLQFSWSGDGWFDGLTTSRNGNSATNGATTTTTDKTSWELDPARRWPVAKNYSDGARIQTPRDAVGNLRAWIGARSITNTYSRDPADQITGISYSDGTPGVSFLYNLRGLITNLLDAAGSHDFVYDNCNRLTSETGTNMSLTMKYCTNSDERASMILAIGAADVLTLDYTFGSDGRLTAVTASQSGGSVSGLAFRYAWDTNENRIATVCAPNGLTNQYQYQTNADLVSAIRIWGATPSAAPILAYTYTYDDADRCTNFARPYESRRDLYAYNSAGYLIKAQRQVTGVWSTAQWCFDTAGNRVSEINGITGRSATQAHNALNQLRSCSYDLDGNLTANGAWSYTWDAENRLTSVKSNGTLIATYQYDAYNRRISKIVGTTTHTYLYDSWNLVAETISNPQSTITNLFVWGADHTGSLATDSGGVRGLLAIITGGTAPTPSAVYYPVMNNHGDVMALFDATGTNIVARYERDPFGVLLSATGPAADACPFGFQTKYCDPETGLIYFGHRYYEPTLAAWLCRDPLEEEGGVNLYGVTGGDPVNGIDPLGLADLENHVLVGAAALCQLGIELEPSDFESFARGLMLPDIPFADVNGIASGQTEIPLAVVLTLKMELSKIMKDVTATTTQIKKELKQKLLFLDWNDPRNWIPGLQKVLDDAAEPKRRVDYWWADSSIVGPALKRIPWVNQTTTVRTHFGDLAYYHGMGDTDQSATELQHNIQTVVEKLLNGYRENRKTNPARAHIQLGMAVHILTDTWTPGHTIRDDEGIILLYQDYNVQSLHFHAENDDLSRNVPREFASATRESAALIQMAMASKAVDAGRFFINDPNARIDLKPGTDQATLWRTLWFGIPRGGTK
jgi:RHS repeat-associated protein